MSKKLQRLLAMVNGSTMSYNSASDAAEDAHNNGMASAEDVDSTRSYLSRKAKKAGGGIYLGILWEFIPNNISEEEQALWVRQRAARHRIEHALSASCENIMPEGLITYLESLAESVEGLKAAIPAPQQETAVPH